MKVQLNLKIRAQPDDATCGPTCLHALNSCYGEQRPLEAQRACKSDPRLQAATLACLDFLRLGGEVRFQDLTKRLVRNYLNGGHPILTGRSATYLVHCPRECGPHSDYDANLLIIEPC